LVDVRGPEEYSGTILVPPEYASEQPQRGGHIPGAINIPWNLAVNEDGTFKSAEVESSVLTAGRRELVPMSKCHLVSRLFLLSLFLSPAVLEQRM
jgi:3-mercaptopyruvate sulfurtransferase SseA